MRAPAGFSPKLDLSTDTSAELASGLGLELNDDCQPLRGLSESLAQETCSLRLFIPCWGLPGAVSHCSHADLLGPLWQSNMAIQYGNPIAGSGFCRG